MTRKVRRGPKFTLCYAAPLPELEVQMRNTWLGNTALLLALSVVPDAALAASDADKAFSVQLEEINKKAVGL